MPLGVAIPPPRQAPLSIEEHGLRRPGIDLAAAVPEHDVRVEPIGRHPESRIRGYGPRDPNNRPRPRRTGLHAQIFRTFDPRQVRRRERLDERGGLGRWHRDLPEVEQPRHPAIRAAGIERRKPRPAGRRVGTPENQRARQKHRVRVGALASVPQNGAANRVAGLPVPGDSQVKQRRHGIPIDRRQDGLASQDDGRRQAQHQTTGFTEPWGELALQRRVEHEGRGHWDVLPAPGLAGIRVRVRGTDDHVEDLAVALIGQPGDVAAVQRDRFGLRPLPGLLSLACHHLDEQSASGAGSREVQEVDRAPRWAACGESESPPPVTRAKETSARRVSPPAAPAPEGPAAFAGDRREPDRARP